MFQVALRFITSNKTQTILIVAGICIGVSVQIFIAVLIDSLQKDLINTTVGSTSHITIESKNEGEALQSSEMILKEIKRSNWEDNKVTIVQTVLSQNAFLSNQADQADSVILTGLNEEDISSGIYNLESVNESSSLKLDQGILIGKDLAEKRNLEAGNSVLISFPNKNSIQKRIDGIFDAGNSTFNSRFVILDQEQLQSDTSQNDKITKYEIQVEDVFDADTVSDDIKLIASKHNLGSDIKVSNWKESNADLLTALQSQSISSLFIQFFVLVSVVIAITSVLNILVVQKSKEIGILKAMGLKDRESSVLFVYQSGILGLLGTLLGMLLGIAILFLFATFAKTEDGSNVINIYIFWNRFLITGLIAFLASILAGVLPSLKTSKLNPVEIING